MLPVRVPDPAVQLQPGRSELRPLTPTRYSLRVTISEETERKLRRAQDLPGHAVPTADLAEVLDRALTALLEQLERTKFAARKRLPVPRDGARCTFVGPAGRCTRTRRLEFHHRVPFAEGGTPTADNIALACTIHNQWEAARWFVADVASLRSGASPTGTPKRADFDQSKTLAGAQVFESSRLNGAD